MSRNTPHLSQFNRTGLTLVFCADIRRAAGGALPMKSQSGISTTPT